jgi:hypothetical protein
VVGLTALLQIIAHSYKPSPRLPAQRALGNVFAEQLARPSSIPWRAAACPEISPQFGNLSTMLPPQDHGDVVTNPHNSVYSSSTID